MLFLFIAPSIIDSAATYVDGIKKSHAVAVQTAAVMALEAGRKDRTVN